MSVVTVSTHKHFAISRNLVTPSWVDFKNPNKVPNPDPMTPPTQRTDGTIAETMYKTMVLQYPVLTAYQWLPIVGLYDAQNQLVLLNFLGDGYTTSAGGDIIQNWYYSPAVFGNRPTGTKDGNLFRDCQLVFTKVQVYVPGVV